MQETRRSVEEDILKVADEDRRSVSLVFFKRSMSKGDSFSFLLHRFLSSVKVRYNSGAGVLATDGRDILVGDKYLLVRDRYGEGVLPFLWAHEILHVIHLHPERMLLVDDKGLYNIIADLYINEELKRRIGSIPDSFVTLSSVLYFLEDHLSRVLTERETRVMRSLFNDVVSGSVSVERVYKVFESIPVLRSSLKNKFRDSSFFGRDIMGNPRLGSSGGSSVRFYKDFVSRAREVLSGVNESLSYFNSFKSMGGVRSKSKGVGDSDFGVIMEIGEYKVIKSLSIDLDEILSSIIYGKVKDIDISFTDINEEGYWLPRDVEIRVPSVGVLLDVSSSISRDGVLLLLSIIREIAKRYNLDGELVTFAKGVRERFSLNSIPKKMKIEGNTVWDSSVSNLFKEFTRKGTLITIILSDFLIGVEKSVYRSIKEYKSRGGRIICLTTTAKSEFCDHLIKIPEVYKE